MKTDRLFLALLLTFAPGGAVAGPNGTLLCEGPKPYDYLSSDTRTFSRFGVRSSSAYQPEPVSGRLIDGQAVKALSAEGLMLVPSEAAGRGQVELRKRGRTLKTIPGWLQSWDLWGDGQREKFMFVVFNGDDASPAAKAIRLTRYIVDGDGNTLLRKDYDDSADPESAQPLLAFSANGEALYEQTDATDPALSRRVFRTDDLRKIAEVTAPRDQLISDLMMVSGDRGFAIVNGRLHRYDGRRLAPLELGSPLAVDSLEMDQRSGRIITQGRDDFALLDLAGIPLFRYTNAVPPRAGASAWVRAKLAIDGSVGFVRKSDDFALIVTRKSGYADIHHLPLVAGDWNRVICFTPNSAALMVDEQPVLVKF